MPILNSIADMQAEMAAWRHDFHQHPELLYELPRTAGLVAERLRAFGCDEVVEGVGRSGVVGVIHGRKRGSGRAIGLRADMDALPIAEATGLPHASQTPGQMHACGHDGHTSMLLGAAKYLCETRNFDGTAVMIFQPAEEGGAGGKAMVDDGMMERFGIQEVYGMHNWPGMPVGEFSIRPGPFFAATDVFDIYVTGKGSHAAKPNDGVDPTVMASQIVLALQTITSRNVDPVNALVVSVTSFQTASAAYNVIPEDVRLKGTVRTLDASVRDMAEARMGEICAGLAAAMGGQVRLDYRRSYPVMVNTAAQVEFAAGVAEGIMPRVDRDAALVMGGEDFAYMLEARPGAYILVGNGESAMLHHPKYDFNDALLPVGASYYAKLVETGMPV